METMKNEMETLKKDMLELKKAAEVDNVERVFKAALGYRAVEDYLKRKIPAIFGQEQEYIASEEWDRTEGNVTAHAIFIHTALQIWSESTPTSQNISIAYRDDWPTFLLIFGLHPRTLRQYIHDSVLANEYELLEIVYLHSLLELNHALDAFSPLFKEYLSEIRKAFMDRREGTKLELSPENQDLIRRLRHSFLEDKAKCAWFGGSSERLRVAAMQVNPLPEVPAEDVDTIKAELAKSIRARVVKQKGNNTTKGKKTIEAYVSMNGGDKLSRLLFP